MSRGGKRPGAGRKPNSTNWRSLEAIAQAENGGEMPLDFILAVMRDVDRPLAVRMDAAIHAAPYCHAKLASVEHKGKLGLTHEDALKALT